MNDLEIYDLLYREYDESYEESIYEDPIEFFGNSYITETHDIFMETKGATKKNIFQRLWNIIIKSFGSIGKIFSNILKWFKNILFGKKSAKTADQIAEDIGLKINNNVDEKPVTISVPSSEESEIELPPIELIAKELLIEYNKEKQSIIFNTDEVFKNVYYSKYNKPKVDGNQGKIVGQPAINEHFHFTLKTILHDQLFDAYCNIVSLICDYVDKYKNDEDVSGYTQTKDAGEIRLAYNKFSDLNTSINNNISKTEIPYQKFEEFAKKVGEINKKFSDINMIIEGVPDVNAKSLFVFKLTQPFIDALNDISAIAFRLQMGINAITSTIQKSFILDKRYLETCSNLEDLDKFIYECIKSGLPPKYIAYNSWIIMSKELKGSNSDKDKPVWGQARVIYYPDNNPKVVHKVALHMNGIWSNKTEREITIKAEQSNNMANNINELLKYIARTVWLSKTGSINSMERLDTSKQPSLTIVKVLGDKVANITKNNIFGIRDLHDGNVGKTSDGKWKFIDYGMAYTNKLI